MVQARSHGGTCGDKAHPEIVPNTCFTLRFFHIVFSKVFYLRSIDIELCLYFYLYYIYLLECMYFSLRQSIEDTIQYLWFYNIFSKIMMNIKINFNNLIVINY